jgi:hypothetical protein
MTGYIKKILQEYKHGMGKKLQTCPFSPKPKKIGMEAQAPPPPDSSPWLNAKGMKRVQQIVGRILYYIRAVDMTDLMALSSIAVEQMKATKKNNGLMHPVIGLPLGQLGHKSPISRIGHDIKHSL